MRRLARLVLVLSALASTALAEPIAGRWRLDEDAIAERVAASLRRQWYQVPAENAEAVTSVIDRRAAAEAAKFAGSALLSDGDVLRLVPGDPAGVPLVAHLIGGMLELKPADATGSALFVFRRVD